MDEVDKNFYERADEHINLSNDQLKTESRGKVSASMMYSVARFNAWISACGWNNGEEMKSAKKETLDYFVDEYRKMLEENLDDYINNFGDYMEPKK
ncbi:DUF3144 domain-containing protein [Aquimarina sp. MMG016]|uniref:DUF3144 domain-containing protein n=1 Tax=Aquimarina sp. MMG016 TaxID=2822690 RepID=UPI001B39E4E5|nr:DUF3144 domain-containing protein [Aquimarina sp. MMG016]MBQ4819319.1 DUF3144 domain-containing protein [Aquimarina sp. MMG016]